MQDWWRRVGGWDGENEGYFRAPDWGLEVGGFPPWVGSLPESPPTTAPLDFSDFLERPSKVEGRGLLIRAQKNLYTDTPHLQQSQEVTMSLDTEGSLGAACGQLRHFAVTPFEWGCYTTIPFINIP